MSTPKHRRTRALTVVILILLSFASATAEASISVEDGGMIDLFTQKEIYNGEGLDVPSDAFSLDEEVRIFAFVTYCGWAEEAILVAFQVIGPRNSVENITFARVAFTNETGITMISFRLPHSTETTFGEWTVIGNARVADQIVQDTLSFKVGWIVEITSIRTVNERYEYQERFPRNSYLGVEITLANIAMSSKIVTLTVNLYDSMNVVFDSVEVIDLAVSSNGTLVYQYYPLYIPNGAHFGDAIVYADAYTAPVNLGGVPYCPEAQASFTITSILHDVAVIDVTPHTASVYAGENVNVSVIIKNLGYFEESFNVTLFFYAHAIPCPIAISFIESLEPNVDRTLEFKWNTQNVPSGNYTLFAYAGEVVGEENLENNLFVDGSVEVISRVHDIAVLDVEPSSTAIIVGDSVDVCVVVKNLGDYEEFFEVTLFYDFIIIGGLVVKLEANAQESLVFHWETEGLQEGSYVLSAYASEVVGEENLENNLFVDGSVDILARARLPLVWLLWLLPFLILIIILVAVWLYYRRKRREEAKKEFYSGWTAWYSRKPISQRTMLARYDGREIREGLK